MSKNNNQSSDIEKFANQMRRNILEVSYLAKTGHIAPALSITDILAVLYSKVLNITPKTTTSSDRDRFILSKGHAAAALYAALYQKGFITRNNFYSFCKDGGVFGVHPEYNLSYGIEMSTGSLGHGLSVGAGIALGLKNLSQFKKIPRVFVLISDAELNEGSIWEGIMFSAHHALDNLTVIVDDNGLQAFGKTKEVIDMEPLSDKWKAFGWSTHVVNGHDIDKLHSLLSSIPSVKNKPTVILANTIAGKGVSFMEGKLEWHYYPLTDELYEQAMKDISKL